MYPTVQPTLNWMVDINPTAYIVRTDLCRIIAIPTINVTTKIINHELWTPVLNLPFIRMPTHATWLVLSLDTIYHVYGVHNPLIWRRTHPFIIRHAHFLIRRCIHMSIWRRAYTRTCLLIWLEILYHQRWNKHEPPYGGMYLSRTVFFNRDKHVFMKSGP